MNEPPVFSDDPGLSSGRQAAEETLGLELSRTARLWRAKLDERFRPLGLTQASWVVLFHLGRGCDGLTQKDLAAEVGVEAPTLVRTLDLIEERNLIARRPAANDRRAKTVHLTDEGRKTLKEMHIAARTLRTDLLRGISPDELTTCLDVLMRIRKASAEIAPVAHLEEAGRADGKAAVE